MRRYYALAAVIFCTALCPALGENMGSAISYQGKLMGSDGQPVVDGKYAVQFRLFDDEEPGEPDVQVAPPVHKAIGTSAGVFTTDLDFGASAFASGQARWLEITVDGAAILPRARIYPTPQALFAAAPWATSGSAVSYTAGNVGVGCATPAYLFQVHGSNMTLDQEQTSFNIGSGTIGAGGFWQSFTAGVSSQLVAVSANFATGAGSSFTLYAGSGTGGAVLCSQQIPASYNGEHFVVLNTPVAVSAGSKYTFLLSSNDRVSIWRSSGDTYPGGGCSAGGDMVFHTYVSSSPAIPLLFADYMTQTVGIFTGTPTARLDVNGDVRMTGFRLGSSATAGQVLTADASGSGTWQSLPPAAPVGPAGGDLSGSYPNPAIAAGAVTLTKIADYAVGPAKLADAAVISAKICGAAVTSSKIAENAVTQSKLASGLDVDMVDGKHASDFASTAQYGVIAATSVYVVSTLVTFSGASAGYLATSGAHDDTLKIYCTGGALEWRLCYGSTISGAAISAGSMNIINYPHDTPFQIKVFRYGTHAVVDLWENDGQISGFYRKNQ